MAISITLAKLLVPIAGDASNLESTLGGATGQVKNFASKVQTIGTGALKALGGGATLAAGAVAGLGAGMLKLAVDAAPLVQVEDAFNGLAESAGKGGSAMLQALKDSSAGMITNKDLMLSFNKAAQLVGTDFAVKLPDAMGSLGKVASATGQDLDFLLDSLVTGVGRLSPMILDNLGIQVDLTAANEEYAKTLGITTGEMDKGQQQAALMNQVLAKLAANTANMPDVAGSAAAGMAAMKATIQDTKDAIGKALVPALGKLLSTFGPIIQQALPKLIALFEQHVVPIVEKATEFIGLFIGELMSGASPLDALRTALESLGLDGVSDAFDKVASAVESVITWVREAVATVEPYIKQAVDWVSQNVQLQDVLIAVGIAIASVVVPAVLSLVASALPIVAVIAAVIAIVALLRAAWESNFLGIRDIAEKVWNWLSTNIPIAIDAIKQVIETVLNFLRDLWDKHGAQVMKVVDAFWGMAKAAFNAASKAVKSIIETLTKWLGGLWGKHKTDTEGLIDKLWKGIQLVFTIATDTLIDIFDAFTALFSGDLGTFKDKIQSIWQRFMETVKTIAENAWNALLGFLTGIWGDLVTAAQQKWDDIKKAITEPISAVANTLGSIWETGTGNIKTMLSTVWTTIKNMAGELWGGVDSVLTKITEPITTLRNTIKDIWGQDDSSGLRGFLNDAWDAIKNIAETVWSKISDPIKNAFDGLKDAWEKAFNAAKEVVKAPLNAIVGFVESCVNLAIAGLNALIAAANLIPGVSISPISPISLSRIQMAAWPTIPSGESETAAGPTTNVTVNYNALDRAPSPVRDVQLAMALV